MIAFKDKMNNRTNQLLDSQLQGKSSHPRRSLSRAKRTEVPARLKGFRNGPLKKSKESVSQMKKWCLRPVPHSQERTWLISIKLKKPNMKPPRDCLNQKNLNSNSKQLILFKDKTQLILTRLTKLNTIPPRGCQNQNTKNQKQSILLTDMIQSISIKLKKNNKSQFKGYQNPKFKKKKMKTSFISKIVQIWTNLRNHKENKSKELLSPANARVAKKPLLPNKDLLKRKKFKRIKTKRSTQPKDNTKANYQFSIKSKLTAER